MQEGLEVDGLVDNARTFTFEAMAELPDQIEDVSAVSGGRQGGAVTLADLIGASQPREDGRYITLHADDYTASVPLSAVAAHALLVYRLNDAPLPAAQGGPVRFLIPDVSACGTDEVDQCASVKRLQRITVTAERGQDSRPKNRVQHVELHAKKG